MRLVLFDIDGTLITTAHAGMRAYCRALDSVFHLKVDDDVIHPDGKTDPLIARELLTHFGMVDRLCESSREALFAAYLDYLQEEMCLAKKAGLVRILPGVEAILDALASQSGFSTGLVTGNIEKGARIKLEIAGLSKYFHFGGYGSDSENRTDLTRVGIRRGRRFVAPQAVEAAFVIGDTPLDIVHGHAAGAFVIAVASARYTEPELLPHNPDLLVPDLMPVEKIIAFMRGCSYAKLQK